MTSDAAKFIKFLILAWLILILAAVLFMARTRVTRAHMQDVPYAGPQKVAMVTPPVYPLSLIPGGFSSLEEFHARVLVDPILAVLYRNFNWKTATCTTLQSPRVTFVTFRRDGKIFWARRPIRLPSGTKTCTDGKLTVLARCANLIRDEIPPVTEDIPSGYLESPTGPPAAPGLVLAPSGPETPGIPALLAGSGIVAGSAGGFRPLPGGPQGFTESGSPTPTPESSTIAFTLIGATVIFLIADIKRMERRPR